MSYAHDESCLRGSSERHFQGLNMEAFASCCGGLRVYVYAVCMLWQPPRFQHTVWRRGGHNQHLANCSVGSWSNVGQVFAVPLRGLGSVILRKQRATTVVLSSGVGAAPRRLLALCGRCVVQCCALWGQPGWSGGTPASLRLSTCPSRPRGTASRTPWLAEIWPEMEAPLQQPVDRLAVVKCASGAAAPAPSGPEN